MDKVAIINKVNKVSGLNKFTLLAIVVVYGLIVSSVIAVIASSIENGYTPIIPEYQESMGEELNPQIVIISNNDYTETTVDNKKVKTYSAAHFLYGGIDRIDDSTTYSSYKYNVDVLTDQNNMVYLEYTGTSSLPLSMSSLQYYASSGYYSSSGYNSILKTDNVKDLFIRLYYAKTVEENTVNTTIKTKISTLTLSDQEKNNAQDGFTYSENRVVLNDILGISSLAYEISTTSTSTSYKTYNWVIEFTDKTVGYRLDMQSWVECEDGTLMPLSGVYNYSDNDGNVSTSNYGSSYRRVQNKFNAQTIYIKLKYYTSIDSYEERVIKFDYQKLINQ